MARYTVQAPDGSTIELEGPDGASPADVIAQAQRLYAERQAPQGAPAAAPAEGEPMELEITGGRTVSPEEYAQQYPGARVPETTAAGIAGAISRGVTPAAVMAGLGALAAPVAGVPVAVGAGIGAAALGASQLLGIDRPFVETLQNLLTRAGVAEPQTVTERIIQSAASGAASAATGVGAGQVLQRATSPLARTAGAMLAESPTAQVTGGIGSGAAAEAAKELGLGAGGQLVAAIVGGMAGSRAARTSIVPAAQAQAAERAVVAEAEKIGVPVMTSDVAPPRTFMGKAAQAAGERVPFVGTGPVRAEQQAARVEAVRDLAREFGATTVAAASEDVMAGLTAARGAKLSQLTRIKGDVINSLVPAGAMPVTRTTAAIDQQIAKLQSLKTKEVEPVIKRLEDWRQSVQGQDIGNIELLRKQLGESFKAPELANVRSTGEKALSSIYGAIRDDMSDFIKTNGQPKDLEKWSVANRELSSMARELKTTSLRSTLERGEATPEAVARMIFSEKPSDVKLLYRNLNDKGKEAAKTAVIARAIEKATVGENVIPEKFRAQLDKLGPQIGVFFKGDDLQRVKGLERVLSATRRAAEAGVMTSTGQQAVPAATALAAGQVSGSALGGAALLGSVGLAARLYESAPVRNLLLKLPTVKTGSPEEAALLKRIIAAARLTQPTEEQPTP